VITDGDAKCSGCKLTSKRSENVECVNELVLNSRGVTTCEIANTLIISLGLQEQKENHVNMCQDLQERLEGDLKFLSKIVTSDETWIQRYDPETKQQSSL
jgi:hypothetical protein